MRINVFISTTIMLCVVAAGAASASTTIGVLTNGETAFWTSVRDVMQAAAKEQDITLDFRMPEPATAEQQNKLALEMMEKGVQALAISPIDREEQLEFIQEISGKLPLVTLVLDVLNSKRAAFIGRDEKEVGKLLGQCVLENIPPGMKVMAFCKDTEASETKARVAGLKAYFEDSGTVLDAVKADQGDRMIAAAIMEEIIKTHPEISALIGLEAYEGPAMINAVTATGRERMVRVIGFGRTPEMATALNEGIAHGIVCDDPAGWGSLLLRTLNALAKNDRENIPENGLITAPITILETESNMTTEEMMHEMQVQVPWISEVAPGVK